VVLNSLESGPQPGRGSRVGNRMGGYLVRRGSWRPGLEGTRGLSQREKSTRRGSARGWEVWQFIFECFVLKTCLLLAGAEPLFGGGRSGGWGVGEERGRQQGGSDEGGRGGAKKNVDC